VPVWHDLESATGPARHQAPQPKRAGLPHLTERKERLAKASHYRRAQNARRAMEDSEHLRKMAEWHRGMARVGHTDSRQWRERFADYLERLADELEAAHKNSGPGP
jgi:hypothetical protein